MARNLVVCALGTFAAIVGITLILSILPLYVAELRVPEPARPA